MSPFSVTEPVFDDLAAALIEIGHHAFARGWVPATSGNFSARLDSETIAITVSGVHKGYLNQADIMLVDEGGASLDDRRPSAETLLHTWLYQWRPEVQAVLHTHSVRSTVLSRVADGEILLDGLEVLKAFDGVDTHDTEMIIPVFPNDQDVGRLADQVGEYLLQHPGVPGYLIAGHGLYTWGGSLSAAMRHLEAFEFLFECALEMRRLKQL
jgi:methylthioribulose-1-phosphate dehydratase